MAGKFIDITGQRFCRLVALYRVEEKDPRGGRLWRFACDCGNAVSLSGVEVRRGRIKSCGCINKERLANSLARSNPTNGADSTLAMERAAKAERLAKGLEKSLSKAEARLAKKDKELVTVKGILESFRLDNIKLRVELRKLKKELVEPRPRRSRERQPAEPWW